MIFRVVKTGNHWFKGARERQRDSVVVGGRKRDVGRERERRGREEGGREKGEGEKK